ncbi:Big-1 (bacterial Ig-like domain 1) domain containing protein [Candidatus Nanopelagicaceae bacterium]
MSTKTTFKRIALVAVAALGLGLLSVAPSNAQDQSRISIVSQDSTGTVGTAVCATVLHSAVATTGDGAAVVIGASLYDSPATSAKSTANAFTWSIPDTTTAVNTAATLSDDSNTVASWAAYTFIAKYSATAAGRTSAYAKLCFTPDKAGTYMTRIFGFPQGTTLAIYTDWTVTVTAPAPLATTSTGYATSADNTSSSAYSLALDETGYLSAAKAAGNLAGTIYVVQSNGSLTNPLTTGSKLTIVVTGSGLASLVALADTCSYSGAVRATTGTATTLGQKICFYSDGTAGTGTVTWSAGSTVLGSSSATFYGAPAKYTATVNNSVISTDAAVSPSTTAVSNSNRRAITVLVTDANGNAVPGANVYMTSSDATVITGGYQLSTSGATGKAYFNLTGVSAGTAALSFTNKSYANDPAITSTNPEITAGPVSVRVGSTKPDKVTVAFDKAEYLPGEKATVTVTVTDSKGNAVPRGAYTVFNSALSTSLALASGTLPGTANANASCIDAYGVPGTAAATCATGYTQSVPALTAGQVWISGSTGTATFTVNMPLTEGTVTLAGTVSTYLPNGLGTSVNAGTAVSATATVAADHSVAQAAADAAAEATDAANAATDAANAAAEAADAATAAAQDAADAVAALSTQVSAMVDALKKQITALTNLVIKIQKKVKA